MSHRRLMLPLLLIAASAVSTAAMDRAPRSLLQLIAGADATVTGKIVELRASTFVLQIEDMRRGVRQSETTEAASDFKAGDSIEITKAFPVCSSRGIKYAIGQRWIVLLEKDELGRWSSAMAGESLIEGDEVLCGFDVPNPRAEFAFGIRPRPRVKLADLQSAIADFPEVFRTITYRNMPAELAQPGTSPHDPQVNLTVTAGEQQAFAKRSRVHKLLIEQSVRK